MAVRQVALESSLLLRQSVQRRCCAYPQDVLLHFDRFVRVKQIQILSHEFKIASRVELSAGTVASESAEEDVCNWTTLGNLLFDANERTGFLARELKSVHVTAEADSLRLRLFDCHANKHNTHSQVGVVAINVLGKYLECATTPETTDVGPRREVLGSGTQTADAAKRGAVEGGLDPKTLREVQRLQRLKEVAVANEDYDEAKRLKGELDGIRSVGTQLASLEAQKREAVEVEDYDMAKQLKEQIQRIREGMVRNGATAATIQTQPEVPYATDSGLARPVDALDRGNSAKKDSGARSFCDAARRDGGGEDSVESSTAHVPNQMAVSLSFGRSKHEEYDDRVAKGNGNYDDSGLGSPAVSSGAEPALVSPPDAPAGFPPDLAAPEPLSSAHAKAAQPLERFAGEFTARCFYSRSWQLREAALMYLQSHAQSLMQPGQEREQFRLLCQVVARGLGDKVANVFLASASFIRSIAAGEPAQARDLQFATAEFVPVLVEKLGETNPRLRDAAHESILTLARLKDGALRNQTELFFRPPKKQSAWRPVLGRLEVVSELVDVVGVGKGGADGFDVDQVMQFVAGAYMSPNCEVRSAAIGLTAKIAAVVGPALKRYVPNDINPKVREQVDREIDCALGSPSPQTTPTRQTRRVPKSDPRSPTSGAESPSPSNGRSVADGSKLSPGSSAAPAEEDPVVLESALQKQEQVLGSDHPDLAEVLTSLAAVYTQREEFDRAYPLLKRVLDINEAHFGSEHSNVAHALTDLAVLHMEQVEAAPNSSEQRLGASQGQDDSGRPLLERALRIQETNLGANHPDVVAIREVLAVDDA